MARLENTFSWSSSRAATFERCRRAYWWQYYGAWEGWERDAPAEARQAYLLKNLSNRWAWVGTAVHEWIEKILRRIRDRAVGGQLRFDPLRIEPGVEVEALTEHMRRQFRQSLDGRYRESPKRNFGLMEHEYEEDLPRETWQEVSDRARDALRAFLESDLFVRIRASDPTSWFAIDHLDQFHLDDVGVWAAPDFAWRLDDGRVEIHDWKTGAVDPDRSRLQMACYTLYMGEKHGIEADRITCRLVYLGPSIEIHDLAFDAAELDAARESIRQSMRQMRALLADADANRANREDFPLTDDLGRCASCAFRRLCGR